MSILFGPIRQIGYVTRDIHASIDFFATQLRIGPWFYAQRLSIDTFSYKGKPYDLDISVAIANSGSLQLELIQQNNDVPSMYQDFLRTENRREQVQHMSTWPEDYDARVKAADGANFAIVQQGDTPRGRFCYLVHPANPQWVLEFGEYTPSRRTIFEAVAAAAQGWDGTEPVRTGFPAGGG